MYKKTDEWSIDESVYKYIQGYLEKRKIILEFGSGDGTKYLLKNWDVISVEHNMNFVNRYHNNYIYSQIKEYENYRWYDIDSIMRSLEEKEYDLILVDGPTGDIGRIGFFHNLESFNIDVPMIFDDINRVAELELMRMVSKKLGRPYERYDVFGVIK